jgi:phage virion morphogenesis protein
MSLITIEVDDAGLRQALKALRERVEHLAPAMKEIGEELTESTKQRFVTSTAPDGSRWAENSDLVLLRFLGQVSGAYRKKATPTGGRGLTARGAKALGGKKPLIGETRNLSSTINYQVVDGGTTLLVGSPEKYASTQQFGAKQGEYGSTRHGAPIPWGDIPARPFLGLSDRDAHDVLAILRRHIARAAGG